VQVRLNYREPGITEREPDAPDNLIEREPKSPMIASPAADNLKPLQVGRGSQMRVDPFQVPHDVEMQPAGLDAILAAGSYPSEMRPGRIGLEFPEDLLFVDQLSCGADLPS
jgi:hypothetical protein